MILTFHDTSQNRVMGRWGFFSNKRACIRFGTFGGFVVFLPDALDRLTGRGYVEATGTNTGSMCVSRVTIGMIYPGVGCAMPLNFLHFAFGIFLDRFCVVVWERKESTAVSWPAVFSRRKSSLCLLFSPLSIANYAVGAASFR